jgi:hypothetical protein
VQNNASWKHRGKGGTHELSKENARLKICVGLGYTKKSFREFFQDENKTLPLAIKLMGYLLWMFFMNLFFPLVSNIYHSMIVLLSFLCGGRWYSRVMSIKRNKYVQ